MQSHPIGKIEWIKYTIGSFGEESIYIVSERMIAQNRILKIGSSVLDNLEQYADELQDLMVEKFEILACA